MMKSLRRLAAFAAVPLWAAAASCNSYQPRWSTNPTFNDPVGSFTLTLDQPSIDVSSGAGTVNAKLSVSGGFTGLVQFNPVGDRFGLVITPSSVDVEGTADTTVSLTLTATARGALGEEQIQIAAAANNQSAEAPLHLVGSP